MSISLPKDFLFYVASPYTKYPDGIWEAYKQIARLTGQLIKKGIKAYSPIAHCHPLAIYAQIDPIDHEFWMDADAPFMAVADALIVARMTGWNDSVGVKKEIETFKAAGKPIYWLDPDTLEIGRGCE
jgi:hypothetical protein